MARSALARRTVTVRRGPSPKLVKLEQRLKRAGTKTRQAAARNEQTLLTLAGAAVPAGLKRAGVELPTVGNVDPALLYGGALMALSTMLKGKNGERLFAVGTGMTAPAIARAIETGSVQVSGDGDEDDDEDDDI